MLSRREMGALCASLLFCLLLSLGAGWAQSQLTTADQLAADTLRLHIRADTDSVRDQSAKLAVRDAVLALTDEACPADSRAEIQQMRQDTLAQLYKANPPSRAQIAAAPGYAVFSNANVNLILASFGGGRGVVHDARSKTDTFMKAAKMPVHVPLSGRTMEFDGGGRCTGGC